MYQLKMIDPKLIVDRVEFAFPMLIALFLAPIGISLIGPDVGLVSSNDSCKVRSLAPLLLVVSAIYLLIALAWVFGSAVRVRYPEPLAMAPYKVKVYAIIAWVSVVLARELGIVLLFLTIEARVGKWHCMPKDVLNALLVLSISTGFAFLFDTFIIFVQDAPTAAAADG